MEVLDLMRAEFCIFAVTEISFYFLPYLLCSHQNSLSNEPDLHIKIVDSRELRTVIPVVALHSNHVVPKYCFSSFCSLAKSYSC